MADKMTTDPVARGVVRKEPRAGHSDPKDFSRAKARSSPRIDALAEAAWRGVGEGGTSPG
jgi:hypothetical protein